MTLTTADDELCRIVEPNVCPTSRRVEVLETLYEANIPTVVWLCPILPYINDTEDNINSILDYCIETNVQVILCFQMGLTLRKGNRQYFYENLDRHFPGLKQ
jgi:DNA repair photolyase